VTAEGTSRGGRGQRVAGAELAGIRHHVRTPVKEILGSSESLIEDASASGSTKPLEALRGIHSAAGAALADINECLANRDSVMAAELSSLGEKIRPRMDRIQAAAQELSRETESWVAPDWPRDLDRMRVAAHSLLEILNSGSFAAAERKLAEPEASAKNGPRVLVVDDNAPRRRFLSRRLERQGYASAEEPNGNAALDRLASEPHALLLLALKLPGMNGLDFLERLKGDRRLQSLPVIVMAGIDDVDRIVRALQMGADDYLFTPFDPVLLRTRVAAVLEKRHLRDEINRGAVQLSGGEPER